MSEQLKRAIDAAAVGSPVVVSVATFTEWLQLAVLVLSAFWFCIRIYGHFKGGRQPTPECARSCPLISRGLNDE